jgi:hypothetical protein
MALPDVQNSGTNEGLLQLTTTSQTTQREDFGDDMLVVSMPVCRRLDQPFSYARKLRFLF